MEKSGEVTNYAYNNQKIRYKKELSNGNKILRKDLDDGNYLTYLYDVWGNSTITEQEDGVGDINPFRWKSQYYDQESGFYYINNRYYSPLTKQYLSGLLPETLFEDMTEIYGINRYILTIDNPINLMYNEHTHETNNKLIWDPPKLSGWDIFWKDTFNWYNNLHWGWKIGIGTVGFIGALGLTAFSGGALAPVFIGMGASVGTGTLISGGITAATGGNFLDGALDGAIDGYMWGGLFASGSSAIGAIKYTRGFRVVGLNEFDDIANTGRLLSHGGAEGKYFWSGKSLAKGYAQKWGMSSGSYRIIGTRISRSGFKAAIGSGNGFILNGLDDLGRAYFMHESVVNQIIKRIWTIL